MPVVLVGPAGPLALALVELLAARGGEVRAAAPTREHALAFRAAGTKAAVCEPGDRATLRLAAADAHTLCLLPPAGYGPEALDGPFEVVSDAVGIAARAGVRRILLRSHPWADPGSAHPVLSAFGRAEEAVRTWEGEHAIVRGAHVVGGGWHRALRSLAARRRPVVPGDGRQVVRPVGTPDAAALFAAADDRAGTVRGTFALRGPEALSAAEVVGRLAAGRRVQRVPPDERWARRLGIPGSVLALLAMGDEPGVPDAAAEFGIAMDAPELDPDPEKDVPRPSHER